MEVRFEDNIYRLYDGEQIGSVEFIKEDRYIENIFLCERARGKGYLRQIIEYFGRPLTILPLHKHIDKFKHLGFKYSHTIGSDIYYRLD